jgi:MFS family permease
MPAARLCPVGALPEPGVPHARIAPGTRPEVSAILRTPAAWSRDRASYACMPRDTQGCHEAVVDSMLIDSILSISQTAGSSRERKRRQGLGDAHVCDHPADGAVWGPRGGSWVGTGRPAVGEARRGWILATLCLAQLMISLDVLIVNVALPSAQRSLGFGIADRQWAVTAYTLAFGSLLLLGGRLSNMFGRKRMFVIGLVGFGLASAAGGAAAYLAIFVIALGQFAMLLFVTYYCHRTLDFTAIQCGFAFLPWLAAFTTMAQVGTRVIAKRVGPRWTLAPGVAIVGIALLMLSRIGVSSSYAADVLPALVLFGAGAGLTISCAVNAATSVVEQADAGAASALVNTSQMIGASVGTAVLNSLAVAAIAGYLAAHIGQANAAVHTATYSYDVVFVVSAVVLLIGSLLIGTLARGELPGHEVISAASRPQNHQGALRGNGQPS